MHPASLGMALALALPESRSRWLIVIGIVLLLVVVVVLWRLLRNRRTQGRLKLPGALRRDVMGVWRRFIRQLPAPARPLVGRYPWVVLLGDSEAPMRDLIETHGELEAYRALGFRGVTNDGPGEGDGLPLCLHLGRRAVLHELSPILLPAHPESNEALRSLWRPLCRVRAPMVVIALGLPMLRRLEPAKIQQMAAHLRNRLVQLRALSDAPILTRLCLFDSDALLGAEETKGQPLDTEEPRQPLAEIAHSLRVPLTISLERWQRPRRKRTESHADSSIMGLLATRFLKFVQPMRHALPKLPDSGFDDIVRSLARAPETLRPVETLLHELLYPAHPGSRSRGELSEDLQLDQLYVMPRRPSLQRANPLLPPGPKPPLLTRSMLLGGLRGALAALRSSRILSTWHAAVCAGLLLAAFVVNCFVFFFHYEAVEQLRDASERLEQVLSKSEHTMGSPGDSALVRRGAFQTGERLRAIAHTEKFWPLLSRAFSMKKRWARQKFLEAIRQAYLVPAIQRDKGIAFAGGAELRVRRGDERFEIEIDVEAEAAMARLIYALAILHASPEESSGITPLVKDNASQWAAALSMSEAVLKDYVDFAPPGCGGNTQVSFAQDVLPLLPTGQQLLTDPLPWLAFITLVEDITHNKPPLLLNRALLLELKQKASSLQAALQLIHRSQPLSQVADVLEEECDVSVRTEVGPLGWALLPPQWLRDNQEALGAVVRLVLASDLDPPSKELSIPEIGTLLEQLSTHRQRTGMPDRVHNMQLQDPNRQAHDVHVSEQKWEDALANARKEQLLARLLNKPMLQRKVPGFAPRPVVQPWRPAAATAAPQPVRPSGGQCGAPQPSPGLAGHYNKTAFERELRPILLGADKALNLSGLSSGDKAKVVDGVLDHARGYAVRYRENLLAHLNSFGTSADSAQALRGAIAEMLTPDSSLMTHLRQVADNATLSDTQGPYLQPLVENLAQFRPIVRLMTPKDGVYPELEPYRAILAQLAGALDGGAPVDSGLETPLRDTMSNLGRLTLGMLADEESSPMLATQRWLDKAGIPPELRGPFLAPVRRMMCLGTAEIERAVEARWRAVREAQVRPLYLRFPFDRNATEEAPLPLLEVLHPKEGALWRFVQNDIPMLAVQQADGNVIPKRLPGGALTLPPDMLPTLSHLGRLSRKLWDAKDGNRKALELHVRPQPLAGTVGPYAVTRAYISVGGAAAVGYNQMPGDRTLVLQWWNQENAAVGIDLSTPDSPGRAHASLDESRAAWSLLRLVTRGAVTADHVVAFVVPVNLPDARGKVEVRFVFVENPFALFLPPKAAVMGVR